jgi:hypothetical protein
LAFYAQVEQLPPLPPLLDAKRNRIRRAATAAEPACPPAPRWISPWRPFDRNRDWSLGGDGLAPHPYGAGLPTGSSVSMVHYGVNGALPGSESGARYS